MAGPMASTVGWRNFWWLNVAMCAFTLLACLFGFPETKWHRPHPNEICAPVANASSVSSQEKATVDTIDSKDIEDQGTTRKLPDLTQGTMITQDRYLGKGTPRKQQFKFIQPTSHLFEGIVIALWTPWKLFAFPIVEFASFVVSWSASAFLTINLTQSEVFAAAPYNFSSTTIGFFNFAMLVGALLGLLTAGPLSDWISMRATRKNRGIREPEMRLPAMIPYVIIMMVGLFVLAFGYQQQWDWKVCGGAVFSFYEGTFHDVQQTFPLYCTLD